MEEKREKFKRIAERRTNSVLEQLRLLGNCANRHNYSYSEEDIKKIFAVIDSEIKEIKSKFNSKSNKEKFRL
ncbi:MAG: hypothetical protein IJ220_04650 [Clostridia bacterium]|nr:hypothetical protein [Clostridia bacterium]